MRSSYHTIDRGARRPMLAALAAAALFGTGVPSTAWAEFTVEEATIDDIHNAIKSGEITCKGLVQAYMDRVKAYNGVCTTLVTADGESIPAATGTMRAGAPLLISHQDHRRFEPASEPGSVRGTAARVRPDGGHRVGSERQAAVRHGRRRSERGPAQRVRNAEHSR